MLSIIWIGVTIRKTIPSRLDAGLYYYENGISKKIIENATGWGVGMIYVNSYVVGYNFVTFNDPYGNEGNPTYSTFNTYTRGTTTLTLKGDSGYEIFSPAAIGVDPLTGNIVIASRSRIRIQVMQAIHCRAMPTYTTAKAITLRVPTSRQVLSLMPLALLLDHNLSELNENRLRTHHDANTPFLWWAFCPPAGRR